MTYMYVCMYIYIYIYIYIEREREREMFIYRYVGQTEAGASTAMPHGAHYLQVRRDRVVAHAMNVAPRTRRPCLL